VIEATESMGDEDSSEELEQIAVVGLACRLPDAPDIESFWQNLRAGKESLRRFTNEELDELGVPASVYSDPSFVPIGTELPEMDCFDARLFGYTPRQAEMIDPQGRIFLETSYAAIENAGYDPFRFEEPIGIFAGSNPNDYALLVGSADITDPASAFDQLIGMEKDFLTTRVSHRLDLKGPALNVQTACSTSLVAVHLACQSLLSYESKMVLAGGVSVNLRQGSGYIYQEGMILSPDGHCRAFDADAEGTTLGQGCGVVVLKRLSEALVDGDTVHAVIKSTAINNDGSDKISYTAPSEDGQTEVIKTALSLADVSGDDITYIETHGTGTSLGDPIEIAALTRAFSGDTNRTGYCAIGSVKTNVGHTDAASGVTGLIKTILALKHREIPASLNFTSPNPNIPFSETPFFVNTELRQWHSDGPRRAGVSSFGIGGTNAHAVLEEPPAEQASELSSNHMILPLSARTSNAVSRMAANLANYLDDHPELRLSDVAFTLQQGRAQYEHRALVIANDTQDAAASLHERLISSDKVPDSADVVFMFSGQGAQYPGMTRDLYRSVEPFREDIDRCAAILKSHIEKDIRDLIFPDTDNVDAVNDELRKTAFTQPALFTVEWSLARLFQRWGIEPKALVGHSIGEYVAATLAEVFTLEDALRLVAVRGRLMQNLPGGSMLSVKTSPDEIKSLTEGHNVELAAANSSRLAVVSGEHDAVRAFAEELSKRDIESQILHTSHAFHSRMMEPILELFAEEVKKANPQAPRIDILSNVTGTWMTSAEAQDPMFWVSQIRRPVRFSDNVTELLKRGGWVFVEIGPGQALATFVRQHELYSPDVTVVTSVRHPKKTGSDVAAGLEAVGRLWLTGVEPNWSELSDYTKTHRIPLPTYPFERERYWAPKVKSVLGIDRSPSAGVIPEQPSRQDPIEDWYYIPTWRRTRSADATETHEWLLFVKDDFLGGQVLDRLSTEAGRVHVVRPGTCYEEYGSNGFIINPASDTDYELLFAELKSRGALPDAIVHQWMADPDESGVDTKEALQEKLTLGVHSVLNLTRALGSLDATRPVRLELVTTGCHSVLGTECLRPEAAALLGPCKVIPLEYGNLTVRAIDLQAGDAVFDNPAPLINELRSDSFDPVVSIRGGHRWIPGAEPLHLPAPVADQLPIRQGGVYLIAGGLGGVGLSVAEYLAVNFGAKLALLSRSGRPDASINDADDETKRRVEALKRVEAAATDTVVLTADILDEDDLRRAVDEAETRLGPVQGVLVAAAVLDDAGGIHKLTSEKLEKVVGTKVFGSMIIARIFEDRNLDFLVFSSSMSTQLYHNRFGQVCYVTGNSFVEAMPLSRDWKGTRVLTVAWDDFLEYGMSIKAAHAFAERTNHGDVSLMDRVHSFTPVQGGVIFERCLAAGQPQVYISTTDLTGRLARDVHAVSPFLQHALSTSGESALTTTSSGDVADLVADVWRDLLGYDTIGPNDDFFELGGDSLQVARMADRLGSLLALQIPLNLVFEAPVLIQFARRINDLRDVGVETIVAEQGPVTGLFNLSPAQTRFLRRGSPNPHRWNISILLEPSEHLVADTLERAFDYLLEHHDAMRLRIRKTGDNWMQECIEAGHDDAMFNVVDLGNVAASEQEANLDAVANELQGSLDIFDGPVIRTALFDLGAGSQRLFVVMHHLITDRVSLFRLLDDLQEVYASLAAGEPPRLPPKSTSYKTWTEGFLEYADSDQAKQDLQQWLELQWSDRKPIPRDFEGGYELNTNASADDVRRKIKWPNGLPTPRGDDPRLDEVVLAALARVVAAWTQSTVAAIDGVGHGRRTFEAPIDVSRTIGFFFTFGTILINTTGDMIKQIRDITPRSWTLEALRYMSNTNERQLLLPEKAEVLFNYVGRKIAAEPGVLLKSVTEPTGSEHDPQNLRDHPLAIMVEIIGDDEIEIRLVYSRNIHRTSTIETLADRLVETVTEFLPA